MYIWTLGFGKCELTRSSCSERLCSVKLNIVRDLGFHFELVPGKLFDPIKKLRIDSNLVKPVFQTGKPYQSFASKISSHCRFLEIDLFDLTIRNSQVDAPSTRTKTSSK